MPPPRRYTPADLAAHRRERDTRRRRARGVLSVADRAAMRRAAAESRRLREHPVARLLLSIDSALSDDALRSGIELAWQRALGRLRS